MKCRILILNLLFAILTVQTIDGQTDHAAYFTVSQEDKARWESYDSYLNESTNATHVKIDSIVNFANKEYKQGQHSKCVELCQLAENLTNDMSKLNLLKGKAYASSSNSCQLNNKHKLKEEVIWAAIDEWNKIEPNSKDFNEANLLIERYNEYLPTKEHFQSCVESKTIKEGDDYYISCWIMKNTKIRFRTTK